MELIRNPLKEDHEVEKMLDLGPVQPRNVVFKSTDVLVAGRLKSLKFQESWFQGRPWLEYSVEDDKACCFYCRVFKPRVNGELQFIVGLEVAG